MARQDTSGMRVAVTASGREMREHVASARFDVAVPDLMLPCPADS